jgi:hypothetical protein
MKTKLLMLVVAFVCLHGAHAQGNGAERIPVSDVRSLMVAAIDSGDGTARGLLTGKDAESITRFFKASGPILVDVTTVKRFSEAGCSRLKVAFTQDGVHVSDSGAPRRGWVAFGINYCRDGKPPKQPT